MPMLSFIFICFLRRRYFFAVAAAAFACLMLPLPCFAIICAFDYFALLLLMPLDVSPIFSLLRAYAAAARQITRTLIMFATL